MPSFNMPQYFDFRIKFDFATSKFFLVALNVNANFTTLLVLMKLKRTN